MKIQDIATKYGLDLNEFAEFIVQHELPFKKGLFSSSVDDAAVPEYVKLFESCKNILTGTYSFRDDQKETFGIMIGMRLPELLRGEINTFNSIYKENPDEAGSWIFKNTPHLDDLISMVSFQLLRSIQDGSYKPGRAESLRNNLLKHDNDATNTMLDLSDAFIRQYDAINSILGGM